MKILIVSATDLELRPFIKSRMFESVEVLVTGVGQVAMTFNLTKKLLAQGYTCDLVINAGVAGSFDLDLSLGTVYQICSDCFADLGIQDIDQFIPIHKMDFFKSDIINDKGLLASNFAVSDIPIVTALTSNIVHGQKDSIAKIKQLFPYQLESMEGAACMYVCKSLNIKVLQLRAVSNYVVERNKSDWKIDLAVENLNKSLLKVLKSLI